MHGGETPLRHSRAAVEIGRDELARLLSDVEPNGRGFGDDDPWLRKLHADRPSARWTACLTRVRVPVVCFWPILPRHDRPDATLSGRPSLRKAAVHRLCCRPQLKPGRLFMVRYTCVGRSLPDPDG